jgi:hypothetical protein
MQDTVQKLKKNKETFLLAVRDAVSNLNFNDTASTVPGVVNKFGR